MNNENNSGSRFIVDLGNVQLPDLLEKRVEAEIQAVVLRALAENDFGSALLTQPVSSGFRFWDQFPGRTLGLWPGFPDNPPVPSGPGVGGEPLTAKDHTLILNAIMEHPLQVIRNLPGEARSKQGRPTGQQVLQAALRVEHISGRTKARIQAVLELLPRLEDGQAALPEAVKKAVDGLRQQLSKKPFEEKLRILRDQSKRSKDGLAEGMEVAAHILEDGKDSIYSLDHSFFQLLQAGSGSGGSIARDAEFGDLADTDTVGATAGGAVGGAVGGVAGATTGAVAIGASMSAGFAIAWALDSLWDIF